MSFLYNKMSKSNSLSGQPDRFASLKSLPTAIINRYEKDNPKKVTLDLNDEVIYQNYLGNIQREQIGLLERNSNMDYLLAMQKIRALQKNSQNQQRKYRDIKTQYDFLKKQVNRLSATIAEIQKKKEQQDYEEDSSRQRRQACQKKERIDLELELEVKEKRNKKLERQNSDLRARYENLLNEKEIQKKDELFKSIIQTHNQSISRQQRKIEELQYSKTLMFGRAPSTNYIKNMRKNANKRQISDILRPVNSYLYGRSGAKR